MLHPLVNLWASIQNCSSFLLISNAKTVNIVQTHLLWSTRYILIRLISLKFILVIKIGKFSRSLTSLIFQGFWPLSMESCHLISFSAWETKPPLKDSWQGGSTDLTTLWGSGEVRMITSISWLCIAKARTWRNCGKRWRESSFGWVQFR